MEKSEYLSHTRGFTLIELMVVVAIIGIVTLIAIPSYRDYVIRGHRTAATSFMLEIANMQERNFLDERAYASSMEDLGASTASQAASYYTVTTTANNDATPPSFTVTAEPKGSQTEDACGKLTLNHLGTKTSEGGTRCWD